MVVADVRLRYTEGGQRAEERRGRGVQSGWPATYRGGPAGVIGRVRLRYTEGGQWAEERRGRGVQSGCTATGGRRFGGFGAKPPPTPGKRKASATTSEGAEMDGLMGWQRSWACRF